MGNSREIKKVKGLVYWEEEIKRSKEEEIEIAFMRRRNEKKWNKWKVEKEDKEIARKREENLEWLRIEEEWIRGSVEIDRQILNGRERGLEMAMYDEEMRDEQTVERGKGRALKRPRVEEDDEGKNGTAKNDGVEKEEVAKSKKGKRKEKQEKGAAEIERVIGKGGNDEW